MKYQQMIFDNGAVLMPTEDFVWLAGMPVDTSQIPPDLQKEFGLPPMGTPPYKGSVKVPCELCDQLLWLGPSQQVNREELKERAKLICMECLIIQEIKNRQMRQKSFSLISLSDKKWGE